MSHHLQHIHPTERQVVVQAGVQVADQTAVQVVEQVVVQNDHTVAEVECVHLFSLHPDQILHCHL